MSSIAPCAPSNNTLRPCRRKSRQQLRNVGDQRLDALGDRVQPVQVLLHVDGRRRVVVLQEEVVQVEQAREFVLEQLRREQIRDAHRAARDLVFICRPDAATGRADGAAPLACSRALSRATCELRISGQAGEIRSRSSTVTPRSMSASISSNNASSATTTPLPIMQTTPCRRMPDGIRCSTVLCSSITSVWPALCPP